MQLSKMKAQIEAEVVRYLERKNWLLEILGICGKLQNLYATAICDLGEDGIVCFRKEF